MAENAANNINYFLRADKSDIDDLAELRQWSNLKVAFEEDNIWITSFTAAQIESIQVKTVPMKDVYYQRDNKLFLYHSLLPDRLTPSCIWTPIERAFRIEIKQYNHNFFGLKDQINIRLVSDSNPKECQVLFTTIDRLHSYLELSAAVRSAAIRWVLINKTDVLLFGAPMLPIDGAVYWIMNNHVLPTGYNFEWPMLQNTISAMINPHGANYIFWNQDASYMAIEKSKLAPLSLSSVRNSHENLNAGKLMNDAQ